jgi:hypothetical protein
MYITYIGNIKIKTRKRRKKLSYNNYNKLIDNLFLMLTNAINCFIEFTVDVLSISLAVYFHKNVSKYNIF